MRGHGYPDAVTISTAASQRKLRLIRSGAGAIASAQVVRTVTRAYKQRIEAYAMRIRGTSDVAEIAGILDEALRETRALQAQARAAEARERVAHAEQQIEQLRAELALVTGLLHEDALTGVLNRRGLSAGFEREAARAERSGAALALILLDLDHFKRLNDEYGHPAGDQALMHFAEIAGGALRPSDILARHGGEEFVILLPDAHLEEARLLAVRLQAALAAAPAVWDDQRMPLTYSAGVAQWLRGESLVECLSRADQALYAAKRAGRNRVKTAG